MCVCVCVGVSEEEEELAYSKIIRSRKPWLSTIERGHHRDGCTFRVKLCTSTMGDIQGVKNESRLDSTPHNITSDEKINR